jgi:P4 family phage/plasmid primase-like protien
MSTFPTIAEAARAHHARGWKPVPISRKTKKPIEKAWQKRPYDPAQFKGDAQNVGIQLGKVSGGLADVDLDCAEAISLAPQFLPPTGAIFGRKSKPASHWLYVTDLCETDVGAVIQFPEYVGGKSDAMIVELRVGGKRDGEYKGATSVFPPSLHESGETVAWVRDGEPAKVAGDGLVHVVRKLAVASLLQRHYPGAGSRHKGALAIGGVLVRAGWNADDIGHVVEQVARAAGDGEVDDRVSAAKGAVGANANGTDVAGLQSAREAWGDIVADTLGHWLKLRALPAGGFEDRIALEFSALHADDLRYVAAWNEWLQWDGVRWRVEKTLHAFDLARVLCRAAGSAAARTVAAVISLARADRRQAATVEQWDADPWKLGTPAGTVDLRTGKLNAPVPTDYITKITAVAPSDAPPRDSCPMWLTFINRVTDGNQQLQDYLQRMCGYALTGSTKEDALFFAWGKGQNGKSVFLNTIADILMDYHETAPMEMFTVTKLERHPADLASLRGARLVTAVETEEGKRWDEAKLKNMTGGEPIKARYMRQNFFTYIPQFKLLFGGNHKPAIRNVDKAISRRMNLIPFLVTIPDDEKDKELRTKLKPEWPGILHWMIDGCLMWQRDGLKPPKIVTAATESYLQAQDDLQRFLDECCAVAKNESDSIEHIWDGWTDWAEDCGEYVGTKRRLGERLEDEKGFERIRGTGGVRTYKGLRCLRENAKKLREQAKAGSRPFYPLRGMKQGPAVPCAHCGNTGNVYKIADGRLEGKGHAETLHEHCAEPFFTGKPPPISARRVQELADWYVDEGRRRHTTDTLDTPTLDAELRAILREEVAAPEHVEDAFARVMQIVFAM